MSSNAIPVLPKRFFELDNLKGPMQWFIDAFVIGISIAAATHFPLCYPLAALLIGARQRALADLLHQATHLALARSRGLNRFLGTWCSGYLVLQTWPAYLKSHVAGHHGGFGKEQDPDYAFMREIGLYGPFGLAQLWRGMRLYWRYLLVNRMLTIGSDWGEALRILALWTVIVVMVGPTNVMLFWLVPMLLAYAPIGYLIEIAEHWPLVPSQHPLYRTRNRASSWLEAWLFSTHHENFHLIHHLYPRLPNTAFKDVDAYLKQVWPEYLAWSNVNGGVVFSSNGAPSVVGLLRKAAGCGPEPAAMQLRHHA